MFVLSWNFVAQMSEEFLSYSEAKPLSQQVVSSCNLLSIWEAQFLVLLDVHETGHAHFQCKVFILVALCVWTVIQFVPFFLQGVIQHDLGILPTLKPGSIPWFSSPPILMSTLWVDYICILSHFLHTSTFVVIVDASFDKPAHRRTQGHKWAPPIPIWPLQVDPGLFQPCKSAISFFSLRLLWDEWDDAILETQ